MYSAASSKSVSEKVGILTGILQNMGNHSVYCLTNDCWEISIFEEVVLNTAGCWITHHSKVYSWKCPCSASVKVGAPSLRSSVCTHAQMHARTTHACTHIHTETDVEMWQVTDRCEYEEYTEYQNKQLWYIWELSSCNTPPSLLRRKLVSFSKKPLNCRESCLVKEYLPSSRHVLQVYTNTTLH